MTHPQPQPNTPASATIAFGSWPTSLHGIPAVADADTPGYVTIVLGSLSHSSLPVFLTVSSLEWLDDLESAVQIARARGIVSAGMVTP